MVLVEQDARIALESGSQRAGHGAWQDSAGRHSAGIAG